VGGLKYPEKQTNTCGKVTAMSEQRDQFQKLVGDLVKQVKEWVEPHEWVTKPYPKKMRDADRQVFEVPALFLQKGPIRVLLDPVADGGFAMLFRPTRMRRSR
jgi:hypothetical protein